MTTVQFESRPDTREDAASKIPALALMMNMGWAYIGPEECTARRGSLRSVLLEDTIRKRLNTYRTADGSTLSSSAKQQVLKALKSLGLTEGLLAANETLYKHLLYGITVSEVRDGKKLSITVPLVDWENLGANSFEVTTEMSVEREAMTQTYRPDIVGFLNGIPVVIIEAKRPIGGCEDKMVEEGISQHLRNQQSDGILSLYAYAQLLFSIADTAGRYGTTNTPKKFWSAWREDEVQDAEIHTIKNRRLSSSDHAALLRDADGKTKDHFAQLWALDVCVTEQDRLLVGLTRPDRLLDFLRYFILFDRKAGKIAARYQQVFGVKSMLETVKTRKPEGGREGGVIWHTTGSGKSYTMVLLCRALLLNPETDNCRVIVITDRTDLEKQLAATFLSGGAFGSNIGAKKDGAKARAGSGKELAMKIGKGNERIIFTLLQKFNSAAKLPECKNDSDNLIVLIDEGHRSQGGENHERMRLALPNAAYLAFTGTPLLKQDKTRGKFGKILHAYTMQRAVEDGTVTPLLYEERRPEVDINDEAVDNQVEEITEGMTEAQAADFKKKNANKGAIYQSERRIALIARDLSKHFSDNFKDLGMKGQLATDSKLSAIRYKRELDKIGKITSAIVISPPDTREGHDDANAANAPEVQQWWKENVTGDPETYENGVIEDFSTKGAPHILIVVDKLLTGFDEPKNAVLYIDKNIKEHNLLQAIARVNRLHEDKQFGYLVDYRGILGELDTSLQNYQELEAETVQGYDPEDLAGTYANVDTEYKKLPKLHKEVWAFFSGVKNKQDRQAFRQVLVPRFVDDEAGVSYDQSQKTREDFYAALTSFGMCLKVALSTSSFFKDPAFTEAKIATYKMDLKFFTEIRKQARLDAQETVDYSAYEKQIRDLVDREVTGVKIYDPEGIIDVNKMGATGDASDDPADWSDEKAKNEADTITSRVRKSIEEDLIEDPYAQAVFSELLRKAIDEANANFEHPHLQYDLFKDLEEQVKAGAAPDIPEAIKGNKHQRAYYGVFKQAVETGDMEDKGEEHFVKEALFVDGLVNEAVAANSLSHEAIYQQINQRLLPHFFSQYGGLEGAKKLIEQIIEKTRKGVSRDSF
ncbi:HsdR family type I site-specific deoxyribonuclease [Pseudovibrio sp. Tun.PSC04-5.I4]|uniref:type I restriction endonuclease subunit R n=1 Tax=Pseudovibrio sp. Tun.PSC04-5.I4 TaxID=1798213 RepID=UPI0008842364|nr:HsdR family type I site-specific deoxyribonuclease [Pseudovibrio sp. Tun.PSC04-5.I4]SDR02442.1 type I restriction enzyme, R subunit [Pseudovibrio sp. Tun.PSC04-5.I4]